MNRTDYLRLAVKLNLFHIKGWVLSAFAITQKAIDKPFHGMLVPEPWGYGYIDEEGNVVKIDDTKPNEPLFSFKDQVAIDSSWVPNVREPVTTYLGNLFFNNVCILPAFGTKFDFITGPVSIPAIEDKIAVKLKSNVKPGEQKDASSYYVDEYILFADALQYLSAFTQISTWAATRNLILPPTGIEAFKAELLKKYAGTLTDPTMLAKFEDELKAFDSKYLAEDPHNKAFAAGKIKNISRKKLFLNVGTEAGFDSGYDTEPITTSLYNGWPRDKEHFTGMMNILRHGSYSRGAETIKGGVTAKYLLRAANNFVVNDGDCGSKLGIRRTYNKSTIWKLVGRHILDKGRPIYVENTQIANNYVDRPVEVRSPMYCKLAGDNICKVCAGHRLAQYPTGLTIPLTDVSGIVLNASMKAMHGKILATAKLNIKTAFT